MTCSIFSQSVEVSDFDVTKSNYFFLWLGSTGCCIIFDNATSPTMHEKTGNKLTSFCIGAQNVLKPRKIELEKWTNICVSSAEAK